MRIVVLELSTLYRSKQQHFLLGVENGKREPSVQTASEVVATTATMALAIQDLPCICGHYYACICGEPNLCEDVHVYVMYSCLFSRVQLLDMVVLPHLKGLGLLFFNQSRKVLHFSYMSYLPTHLVSMHAMNLSPLTKLSSLKIMIFIPNMYHNTCLSFSIIQFLWI